MGLSWIFHETGYAAISPCLDTWYKGYSKMCQSRCWHKSRKVLSRGMSHWESLKQYAETLCWLCDYLHEEICIRSNTQIQTSSLSRCSACMIWQSWVVDSNKTISTELHTVFSFSDDLTSGIRGCTLNAFEENTIIAVASINRDRRRDGGSEPTNKYKQHQHLQLLLFVIWL